MYARHIKIGLRIDEVIAAVNSSVCGDPGLVADYPEILVVDVQAQRTSDIARNRSKSSRAICAAVQVEAANQ